MKSMTVVLASVLENAVKIVAITELFIYYRSVPWLGIAAITDRYLPKNVYHIIYA